MLVFNMKLYDGSLPIHLIGHNQLMLVKITPAHPHFTVVCLRVQLLVQLNILYILKNLIRLFDLENLIIICMLMTFNFCQSCLLLKFLSFDQKLRIPRRAYEE